MHPPEGSVSAVFWYDAESVVCGAVATGDVHDLGTTGVMTGQERHADVVILAALREEYEAVLQVDAGAVPNSAWERTTSADGLPIAFRSFEVPVGRPLRVAAAVAADMGATAAIQALLPLVELLRPRCIAMCGVCAGRPGKDPRSSPRRARV